MNPIHYCLCAFTLLSATACLPAADDTPFLWSIRPYNPDLLHLYWVAKPNRTYIILYGYTPTSITNVFHMESACHEGHPGVDNYPMTNSMMFFRLLTYTNAPCLTNELPMSTQLKKKVALRPVLP